MSSSFRSPYPGYDVLAMWDTPSFNAQTRRVLDMRMQPPARQFFTELQWDTLQALCACVLPQPERAEPVPVAAWIDADLQVGRSSGTRYASLPEMGAAWMIGLAAIEAEAQQRHRCRFSELDSQTQSALLKAVDEGSLSAPDEWQGMPSQRFFRQVVLKHVVSIYYAHPAAMSEIGFGGPASPRGYVRLDADRFDSWEAPPGRWSSGDQAT